MKFCVTAIVLIALLTSPLSVLAAGKNEMGAVEDPVVVENCGVTPKECGAVCENSPNSVFDTSAINAALKFRYEPKIVDGKPAAVSGVQNRLDFALLCE